MEQWPDAAGIALAHDRKNMTVQLPTLSGADFDLDFEISTEPTCIEDLLGQDIANSSSHFPERRNRRAADRQPNNAAQLRKALKILDEGGILPDDFGKNNDPEEQPLMGEFYKQF